MILSTIITFFKAIFDKKRDWQVLVGQFSTIRSILKTSGISILLLLLVFFVLTKMEQGPTIVIDLFDSWVNLVLFYVLGIAFVFKLTHYPLYFYLWQNKDDDDVKELQNGASRWSKFPEKGWVGIVSYELSEKTREKKIFERIDRGWSILGMLTIFAAIYVLLFCARTFIWPALPIPLLMVIIFLVVDTIVEWLLQKSKRTANEIFLALFYLGTTLAFICMVLSIYEKGWSIYFFILFLAQLIIGAIAFPLYRYSRLGNMDKVGMYRSINKSQDSFVFSFLQAGFTFVAVCIFLTSQIIPYQISSINIILSGLIMIYAIIMFFLKHRSYYIANPVDDSSKWGRRVGIAFSKYTSLVGISFLILILFTAREGNDMHLLIPIKEEPLKYTEADYIKMHAVQRDSNQVKEPLYFVASYGGGLKANAWTMMVLDKMQKESNNQFMENTFAMSGISGGALGIAFYSAIQQRGLLYDDRKILIDSLAESNQVSKDIAWMIGWDFLKELWPFADGDENDRAKQSMEDYEKLLGTVFINDSTYRNYWERNLNEDNKWPVLIMNTAGTNLKKGVACSLKPENFKHAFPDAIDILDYGNNTSLSYAHAVSTSNRFPAVSPAAKLQNKGQFVDGGYFENSGLLSLWDYYKYISQKPAWKTHIKDRKVVFLLINNHKSTYIEHKFGDLIRGQQLNHVEQGELGAIISTGTAIDYLPPYVSKMVAARCAVEPDKLEFRQVFMKYRLTMQRIQDHFGIAVKEGTDAYKKIQSAIDENNNEVNELLKNYDKWEITEPSTARLLGRRSVKYMRACVNDL